MKQLYAGELNGERRHSVDYNGMEVEWSYGDDWKKVKDRSVFEVEDKSGETLIKMFIRNSKDLDMANKVLKTLGIEVELVTETPRWTPKEGETYWYINIYKGRLLIEYCVDLSSRIYRDRVEQNNCFRTKKEVKERLAQILEVLKHKEE